MNRFQLLSQGVARAAAFGLVTFWSVAAWATSPEAPHGDAEIVPEATMGHGHGGGGFQILTDRDFWLHVPTAEDHRAGFLYLLINFAVLMWVVNKVLIRNLRTSNAEKSDHIKLELDRASEARSKAEGIFAEYEGRLTKLDEEIEAIKKQAHDLAHAEGEHIISEAKSEAEKIRRAAVDAAEREGRIRQQKIEAEVVHRAMERAEAMIAQSFNDADQRRLVDAYVAEVDAVDLTGEKKAS